MTSLRRSSWGARTGAVLVVVVGLTAGCGAHSSGSQGSPTSSPSTSSGTRGTTGMKGMDMGGSATPSQPAKMICSAEIRDAVTRTFALPRPVTGTGSWNVGNRVYACSYRVPGGILRLSVQDALTRDEGAAHFRGLRGRLPGATAIRGVEGFGLPSLQTTAGQVAFLKDGKTLVVDSSGVRAAGLPRGYSRSESAYAIAAAVVACWSE